MKAPPLKENNRFNGLKSNNKIYTAPRPINVDTPKNLFKNSKEKFQLIKEEFPELGASSIKQNETDMDFKKKTQKEETTENSNDLKDKIEAGMIRWQYDKKKTKMDKN